MKRQFSKREWAGAYIIVLAIGLLIDVLTHNFEPVPLVFSVAMIMLGRHDRKKGRRVRGNILLGIGILIAVVNVISLVAFHLAIVMGLLYVGFQLLMNKQHPIELRLEVKERKEEKPLLRSKPFLQNMFIGQYRVMDQAYELDDINIRYGFGDVDVDLSMAMIPEGETVIVLHGIAGNIRLYVPYDIELKINHSMLAGNLSFMHHEEKGWNKNIVFETDQYISAPRRVKIMSSLLIGDMEVRYV